LQEIFENSLLNLSIENSKQISNNHPHNRANHLYTHHCRDMEALVMTTSDYNSNFMPEIQYKPSLPEFKAHTPSQLDRIEKRLDAIEELLAVLLDSVQAEQEEEVQMDLDGEVTERIKHEQEWL
jgi:hypothetical protein